MCELRSKAVAAGLGERMVRVAEQQGALIAQVIRAVLDRIDLTQRRELAAQAVGEELIAVAA